MKPSFSGLWQVVISAILIACGGGIPGAETTSAGESAQTEMDAFLKIQFVVGETIVPATLEDHASARDFVGLLPLVVTLRDYARTERTFDLPGVISKAGAPTGYDPEVGDITYYAPWGNIAIFHRDFGYADGLIFLGRIDDNLQALVDSGLTEVRVERVNEAASESRGD